MTWHVHEAKQDYEATFPWDYHLIYTTTNLTLKTASLTPTPYINHLTPPNNHSWIPTLSCYWSRDMDSRTLDQLDAWRRKRTVSNARGISTIRRVETKWIQIQHRTFSNWVSQHTGTSRRSIAGRGVPLSNCPGNILLARTLVIVSIAHFWVEKSWCVLIDL